jgi:hypothetical protein
MRSAQLHHAPKLCQFGVGKVVDAKRALLWTYTCAAKAGTLPISCPYCPGSVCMWVALALGDWFVWCGSLSEVWHTVYSIPLRSCVVKSATEPLDGATWQEWHVAASIPFTNLTGDLTLVQCAGVVLCATLILFPAPKLQH